MKKIITCLLAPIMFLMVISISSCKKYDEGPGFSLNSKKSRVVNQWEIYKATVNNQDITSFLGDFTITFRSDNSFSYSSGGDSENGKWEFNSNKESLILTYPDNYTEIWEINKLKKDEMWVEFDSDGETYEIHFVTR